MFALQKLTIAAAAAVLSIFSAQGAFAECVIAEHADFRGAVGTIQNNDLVQFFPKEKMGLTGERQFKREFNDASWAGKVSAVEPKNGCMATIYGPWGHRQIRERTPLLAPDMNDKATGVGCACK